MRQARHARPNPKANSTNSSTFQAIAGFHVPTRLHVFRQKMFNRSFDPNRRTLAN